MLATSFLPATTGNRLGADDVHVWRLNLDASTAVRQRLETTLSAEERVRAARFHFEQHRRRFIVARGALRTILADYLETEPWDIVFRYGPQGKPSLAEASAGRDIRFNLSHSEDLALVAFAEGRELGVDVERVRADADLFAMAERFFAANEVETLRNVPQALQDEAFFNCWTRKEAYIKARGEGMTLPLHRFCVSLKPGDPPALLAAEGNPGEVARWSMAALHPCSGFISALVVEGQGWQIRCWQWREPLD